MAKLNRKFYKDLKIDNEVDLLKRVTQNTLLYNTNTQRNFKMIRDMKRLTKIDVTEPQKDFGVIECYVEVRSEDWWITYTVYKDKVEVTESMDNMNHCIETCNTLEEAIQVASQWC